MKETLKNNKEFVVLVWIALTFTVMTGCLVSITLKADSIDDSLSGIDSSLDNMGYVSSSIEELERTIYQTLGR